MRILLIFCLFSGITPSFSQDLALQAPGGSFILPLNGCNLGSSETVYVTLFNYGEDLSASTSFNVSYTVNGGSPVTENVVLGSPLLSNTAFSYVFTTPANLSTPGTYSFSASVSLPGDINPSNNTFSNYTVTNYAPSAGGYISGSNMLQCAFDNSGTLTLSGYTGNILRWELMNVPNDVFHYISQTTTTQSYLDLDTTTVYRAVVQNGPCPEAFSSSASVLIECGLLPLQWKSFVARMAPGLNHVLLNWTTATEGKTKYFAVERKTGEGAFENIATLGSSSQDGGGYHFTDTHIPSGKLYYRIKQVSSHGDFSYSPIQAIGQFHELRIKMATNPLVGGQPLAVEVEASKDETVSLAIFNAAGRNIWQGVKKIYTGANIYTLPIPNMAAGIYWLKIFSDKDILQQKLLVR